MPTCEHCDQHAPLDECGLCPICRQSVAIRELYERGRDWSPTWEEHLRNLARRAKAGRPLFEDVHSE